MNFFDQASLRLKQHLGLPQDKDVAAALGISARAWAGRKGRDNFPSTELRLLAAQRPDLGLDVDWIVTGSSNKMEAANTREASLLQNFQKLSDRDQLRLLSMAQLWSGEMVLALPTKNK